MVRPKAFTDRFQLGGQSISLRIAILSPKDGLRLPTSSSQFLISKRALDHHFIDYRLSSIEPAKELDAPAEAKQGST